MEFSNDISKVKFALPDRVTGILVILITDGQIFGRKAFRDEVIHLLIFEWFKKRQTNLLVQASYLFYTVYMLSWLTKGFLCLFIIVFHHIKM